tara:strand:+ start:1713 stop:1946 length:234 start_codon:yes stop_codon:yes gene_type:complete
MLQQFINWFWNNGAEEIETKVECKHYAAHKIEKAYLEYKSRQRVNNQIEIAIDNIVQDLKYKHKLASTKPKKLRLRY